MLLEVAEPTEEPGKQEGNRVTQIFNPVISLPQQRRLLISQNLVFAYCRLLTAHWHLAHVPITRKQHGSSPLHDRKNHRIRPLHEVVEPLEIGVLPAFPGIKKGHQPGKVHPA
jgi:hypothetical protein